MASNKKNATNRIERLFGDNCDIATKSTRKAYKRKKYARKNVIPKNVTIEPTLPFVVTFYSEQFDGPYRTIILDSSLDNLHCRLAKKYSDMIYAGILSIVVKIAPKDSYNTGCSHTLPDLRTTIPTKATHKPQTELSPECKFAMWNRQQQINPKFKPRDNICGLGW